MTGISLLPLCSLGLMVCHHQHLFILNLFLDLFCAFSAVVETELEDIASPAALLTGGYFYFDISCITGP